MGRFFFAKLWKQISKIRLRSVVRLNEKGYSREKEKSVCVCPQFPYSCKDTIFWIFPIVPCHAFCMWHWPVGKDLDLSFIWDHHHLHFVGLWMSVDKLITSHRATPCWRDPTRSKQLSTVAILGFQFGLYHVVAPLSFLHSTISLASLFAILSIFACSDLLQILRQQAAFSFAVLCIIMFFLKLEWKNRRQRSLVSANGKCPLTGGPGREVFVRGGSTLVE